MSPLDGESQQPLWRRIRQRFGEEKAQTDSALPKLRLHEWEIWHTYTTYLNQGDIDPDQIARRLVELEIAACAMTRDGRTYWKAGQKVGSGSTDVRLNDFATGATVHLDRDPGCDTPLEGFALEAWGEAGHFRFNELRVFGEDEGLPPPYVRAFLGQCKLISEDETSRSEILLYPVLLIFLGGVMVLELRTISPDTPTELDHFIDGAVNLFQHRFDRAEVPPNIVKLATRAYYHSYRGWSFRYRLALIWMERGHDKAVRELTKSYDEGDFTFHLAPLTTSDKSRASEKLNTLALTLLHTVAFVLGEPRLGLAFVLRGQKQTPQLGDYWSGRPHIYIARFDGQRETASENARIHGAAFGSILLRAVAGGVTAARRCLPPDSRFFDDYNAYITSAASLWVWSNSGLRQQAPSADANRGHLIYEHQAVVELLEYGYMLHRSLLDRVEKYENADEVLAARRALITLEQTLAEASHFGEIRDLLDCGWREMKLPELRQRIQDALAIREAEASVAEARVATRIRQALTVLFGLIAVPSLGERVIQPLWKLIGIPHPDTDSAFQTITNAVALVFVGLVVLFMIRRLQITGQHRKPNTGSWRSHSNP
jgi:hypothetical protein